MGIWGFGELFQYPQDSSPHGAASILSITISKFSPQLKQRQSSAPSLNVKVQFELKARFTPSGYESWTCTCSENVMDHFRFLRRTFAVGSPSTLTSNMGFFGRPADMSSRAML